MLILKKVVKNGKAFIWTYSDKGLIIRKVGTNDEYIEAYDLIDKQCMYVETDKPIPKDEPETFDK